MATSARLLDARSMLDRLLRRFNRAHREATLRQGYRPAKFWEVWGRTFADEDYQRRIHGQHAWLSERLSQSQIRSVLEVGCGFGRNLTYLREAHPSLARFGLDISRSMLQRAVKEGTPPGALGQVSATAMPLQDASFDAVFTMGLCMHVPPDQIGQVFAELARVSRDHVLIVEQQAHVAPGVESKYTFIHDYAALAAAQGLFLEEASTIQNNETLGCFHFRKGST